MNRTDARRIAETITDEELHQMFINAQNVIKDWEKRSNINPSLSIGTAFNILSSTKADSHILAKTNAVREFGEYGGYFPKPKTKKKESIIPYHQEPVFIENTPEEANP